MNFQLSITPEAKSQIAAVMDNPQKAGLAKQIKKALQHLATNPNHPGLHSHSMPQFDTMFGTKVFSSYIQNKTPGAYRLLWVYGPNKQQITVVAVIPHY